MENLFVEVRKCIQANFNRAGILLLEHIPELFWLVF